MVSVPLLRISEGTTIRRGWAIDRRTLTSRWEAARDLGLV
jgi:hypothetical protein